MMSDENNWPLHKNHRITTLYMCGHSRLLWISNFLVNSWTLSFLKAVFRTTHVVYVWFSVVVRRFEAYECCGISSKFARVTFSEYFERFWTGDKFRFSKSSRSSKDQSPVRSGQFKSTSWDNYARTFCRKNWICTSKLLYRARTPFHDNYSLAIQTVGEETILQKHSIVLTGF